MRWTWEVDDHRIVADMNVWTGKRTVTVDGADLTKTQGGLRARFGGELGRKPLRVEIGLRYGISPTATLELGGHEIAASGGPAPMPWWAWPFVAACIAIVAVAGGGAIPGALAGAGAAGCYYGAIAGPSSAVARLALCAGITAACWGGYYALLMALT